MPDQKAFENCYPFMYYLMHGENYIESAKKSHISVQPTLVFYGLCQLMKASILTIDPDYPSHSNLLAHGVSTRKRKKQNYNFLRDEVKIQKNGLYGHMASLIFNINHIEGEKFSMKQLLKKIPELQTIFTQIMEENLFFLVTEHEHRLNIDKSLADFFFVSSNRLKELLEEKRLLTFIEENKQTIIYKIPDKIEVIWDTKLHYNISNNSLYLPKQKENLEIFPEVLVYYLVLYNLSMIARYETEWWYDLLFSHSSIDYIFISRFLEIVIEKIPLLFYPYFEQLFILDK